MANNYEQATVYPYLPKLLFSESDLGILESSGFEWEDYEDSYYFFAPECLGEDDEQGRSYLQVFQDALRASKEGIKQIVIEGAFTCSKMRQGEFGGFVIRITETELASGSTKDIVSLMEDGVWFG